MADDTLTVEQARQNVIGAVLSYADALRDGSLPPSSKAMALKAVADAFDALIAAVRAENTATQACEEILKLSAGWDAHGSVGPTPPLSWESVARMALDQARYALRAS